MFQNYSESIQKVFFSAEIGEAARGGRRYNSELWYQMASIKTNLYILYILYISP